MYKESKQLNQIKNELLQSGIEETNPKFALLLEERKVKHCQELHDVFSCQECSFYADCPLAQSYYGRLMYSLNSPLLRENADRERKIRAGHIPWESHV